jgi:hypothetical protein
MKNILMIIIVLLLFITCKNKDDELLQKQATATEEFNTCLKSKKLPIFPKQDTYIEGELNGQYFSLSNHKEANVYCSLGSFRNSGYKQEYTRKNEGTGNAFYVYPIGDSSDYKYFMQFEFPSFNGDTIAYEKYFEQFQKGKSFKFLKEGGGFESLFIPDMVYMYMTFEGCNNIGYIGTKQIDQTGSYFRVVNVKEVKDGQGNVIDREVTIEFDVQLGRNDIPVGRIKNGKMVFWY